MDELDLSVHSVEEIPGKVVVINGVCYACQQMIAEGKQARIYPIKNVTSGLIQYVAKVMKCKPGTEEYEWNKSEYLDAMRILEGSEEFPEIIPTELYEIHGGLIRFQELLSYSPGNPEGESSRMEEAAQHSETGNPEEALKIYNQILERNPHHSHALVNKAICVWDLEQSPIYALDLIMQAIKIEPNDRRQYQLAADCFVAQGKFLEAIAICQDTLDRWKFDYETSRKQAEIAIEYDLLDSMHNEVEQGLELYPGSKYFEKLTSQIQESRKRAESYRALLERAQELQSEDQWEQALRQCEEAAQVSENNFLAHLNACICKYHAGEQSLGDELVNLLFSVQGNPLSKHHQPAAFYVCAVLALLSYQAAGDNVQAKSCALLIWPDLQHPIDLPGVPTAMSDGSCKEELDVEPIITALNKILTSSVCESGDRAAIESMIGAYKEKKKIYSRGTFRRWMSRLFSRSE